MPLSLRDLLALAMALRAVRVRARNALVVDTAGPVDEAPELGGTGLDPSMSPGGHYHTDDANAAEPRSSVSTTPDRGDDAPAPVDHYFDPRARGLYARVYRPGSHAAPPYLRRDWVVDVGRAAGQAVIARRPAAAYARLVLVELHPAWVGGLAVDALPIVREAP